MNKTILEYAKWLNTMRWDYFCTFTTSYQLSRSSARRMMEKYYQRIKRHCPKSVLFWVAESNKNGNGCHVHSLVNVEESRRGANFSLIHKTWESCSGGKNYQTILEYQRDKGAEFYLIKALGNLKVDYDMLGK